eukprot:746367-Hanusia_phi.AAC.2
MDTNTREKSLATDCSKQELLSRVAGLGIQKMRLGLLCSIFRLASQNSSRVTTPSPSASWSKIISKYKNCRSCCSTMKSKSSARSSCSIRCFSPSNNSSYDRNPSPSHSQTSTKSIKAAAEKEHHLYPAA